MNEVLHTKFGNAKINCRGYLTITSRKEGNNRKYLHRLIWEEVYGEIPQGYVIHHKNGNKLDNCILNLQLMKYEDHASMHNKNRVLSEETRKKLSELAAGKRSGKNNGMYGKLHTESTKLKMSKKRNKTGFFRVCTNRNKRVKQGFNYAYKYFEDGKIKAIVSINIEELKQKVIDKGLPWIVLDEEKARKTMETLP